MKQAIAGVAPSEIEEVEVMTVWPSNSAYELGRFHGRLYDNKTGFYIFTVGNLMCLLSIPGALALYFWRLAPWVGKRYTLTNRRVVEYRSEIRREPNRVFGIPFPFRFHYTVVAKSVDLDRFDTVEIEVRPGQEWYHAGDLVFRLGNVETFRLDGVSRPEAFRQSCLKSRLAFVGVKEAVQREAVSV
jgi:hypothetical protein